jgi:hypothetical protein
MPVREDRVGPPRDRPWRPAVGIAPQLSDAELVTLAMMQAMLGFTSEARWLRHARSHLRHLFPYLPKQPGYNKRLRMAGSETGAWSVGTVRRLQVQGRRSRGRTDRRVDHGVTGHFEGEQITLAYDLAGHRVDLLAQLPRPQRAILS